MAEWSQKYGSEAHNKCAAFVTLLQIHRRNQHVKTKPVVHSEIEFAYQATCGSAQTVDAIYIHNDVV